MGNIHNTTGSLFFILAGFCLISSLGCSVPSSQKGSASEIDARVVAQHTEQTGQDNVVTKVIEERKNGVHIIKIQVIKNGQVTETIHHFDSDNFSISIPVSAHIMVQNQQEGEKIPDNNILVFSQQLDLAREAMLKTEYVSALEALNEALKVDSYNPRAHMMKGSIFYAMGKYKLARKEFDFVLKVAPDNVEVKRFKAFMDSKSDTVRKVNVEGLEKHE
jgi:hypothetical protein